ncbi:hypothetical protein QE152_g26270 [Popillia japonica]|uniref:Uncharacterized protein n=1 Tax=Popillia japonica TaxID=7064 RepID=A0AAW1JYI4_POPJA
MPQTQRGTATAIISTVTHCRASSKKTSSFMFLLSTHIRHNGTACNTLDLLPTANTNISDIKTRTLPSDHLALEFRLGEQDERTPERKRSNKYLRTERHQITVIEDEEGSAVFRDRDIAEKIASAFESYHATPNTSDQTELQVQSALNNFFLQNPIFPVRSQQYITSPKVIKKLIKQSPFLKAPGKDGI